MRKFNIAVSVLLTLVLCLSAAPITAFAGTSLEGMCGDNLYWYLYESDGQLAIEGSGPMYDYTQENPAPWSEYRNVITNISLSGNVTHIGDYAFAQCHNLEHVEFSANTITEIGAYAFSDCSALISIDLPNSLISIDAYSFAGTSLTNGLSIPANVANLGPMAFANSQFSNVTFLGDCPKIDQTAFTNVLAVARYPFFNTTWTQDSLHGYGGDFVWEGFAEGFCGDDLTWSWNENSKTIWIEGSGAMYDYSEDTPAPWQFLIDGNFGINHIDIRNYVTDENITYIGSYAFKNFHGSVAFYTDAPQIHDTAFTGAVANIGYPARYDNWSDEIKQNYGGDLCWLICNLVGNCGTSLSYDLSLGTLRLYGSGNMYDYSLGDPAPWSNYADEIKEIYDLTGSGSSWSPDTSITHIGANAFAGCALVTVNICSDTTKSIGDMAFADCAQLDTINFIGHAPDHIGENAFKNVYAEANYTGGEEAGWTSENMLNYGGNLYWFDANNLPASGQCGDNLTWVFENGVVTVSGTGDMWNYENSGRNHSPWDGYKYNWGRKIQSVIIEEGVTSIGDYAFRSNYGLNNLTLPSTLKHIGDYAFSASCIQQLILPEGLVSIGDEAFSYTEITTLTIPGSLDVLGRDAFIYCTELAEIHVSPANAAYSSADGILYNKEQTTLICYPAKRTGSLTLPNSVTTISDWAFQFSELSEIVLPASLESIGDCAFQSSLLTTVTFTGSAPTFGYAVFNLVDATAYYPEGNPTWTEELMKSVTAENYRGTLTWVAKSMSDVTPPVNSDWLTDDLLANITVTEVSDKGDIIPDVQDEKELIDAALTDEEKLLVIDGVSVTITVNADFAAGSVSEADLSIIQKFAASQAPMLTIDFPFDLSMSLQIGENHRTIEELSNPTVLSLPIPTELQSENREFCLIHVHNGVAEILEDLDTDPTTITFRISNFSAIAFAYTADDSIPTTGDLNIIPVSFMLICSAASLYIIVKKKRFAF